MRRSRPNLSPVLRAVLTAAIATCLIALLGLSAVRSAPKSPAATTPLALSAHASGEGAGAAGAMDVAAAEEGESSDEEDNDDHRHGKGDVNLLHDVTVGAGEVRDGDLVAAGGDVEIHGEVRGDLVVFNGTLVIDGRVDGDTVAILTNTTLAKTAVIGGDFVHLGGDLDVSPKATIHGERFQWDFSHLAGEAAKSAAGGVLRLIYIFKLLLFSLLFWAMLIAISVSPRQITAAGGALGQVWGRAIFMGLVAYAAYFVLLGIFIILCLILIGIPLLALLIVTWFAIQAIGLAAILWVLGDRISRNVLRREMAPIVAFLIGFLIYLPTQVLPFHLGLIWLAFALFGNLLNTCLSVLAIGLALVTQFGRVTEFPLRSAWWISGAPPPPAPGAPAPA